MNQQDRDELRNKHYPYTPDFGKGEFCNWCVEQFPCDTIQVLEALEGR
jgi:hypothetical protein